MMMGDDAGGSCLIFLHFTTSLKLGFCGKPNWAQRLNGNISQLSIVFYRRARHFSKYFIDISPYFPGLTEFQYETGVTILQKGEKFKRTHWNFMFLHVQHEMVVFRHLEPITTILVKNGYFLSNEPIREGEIWRAQK